MHSFRFDEEPVESDDLEAMLSNDVTHGLCFKYRQVTWVLIQRKRSNLEPLIPCIESAGTRVAQAPALVSFVTNSEFHIG